MVIKKHRNSLLSLLPAYALSEIKICFIIGFYLICLYYWLVVSCILLALVWWYLITLSVPLKLILFIAMDGWGLLSKDPLIILIWYELVIWFMRLIKLFIWLYQLPLQPIAIATLLLDCLLGYYKRSHRYKSKLTFWRQACGVLFVYYMMIDGR